MRLCGFAKVLPAHKLEDQLVECDFGLVVCTGKANQLAIQIHGEVPSFAIVYYLFAVHTLTHFLSS